MKKLLRIIRVFAVASVVTFIWFLVAFSGGQGYWVIDSSSKRSINNVPGHIDQVDETITGSVAVQLNSWAYPVSQVLGRNRIDYSWSLYIPPFHMDGSRGGPHDSSGIPTAGPEGITVDPNQVAEDIVFNELPRNLPLFFLIGLCIGYLANKSMEGITKRRTRALAAKYPDLDAEALNKLADA